MEPIFQIDYVLFDFNNYLNIVEVYFGKNILLKSKKHRQTFQFIEETEIHEFSSNYKGFLRESIEFSSI